MGGELGNDMALAATHHRAKPFPQLARCIGVFPDLPWTFIDYRLRQALGLEHQRLGTVRIRSSRAYQLKKELREMMLLLGIAFIGVVSILKDSKAQVASLVTLIVLVVLIATLRMRRRFSPRGTAAPQETLTLRS